MVIVTGGTGFLGRAVVARLSGALAVGSSTLDMTDGPAVHDAIATWRPSVVVHLAARVGGITANLANQADFLVDNLRMDANLLAALRVHPPEHLVTMLSTCMYPDALAPGQYPMSEASIEAGAPPPTNASYAAAKRALWHGTRALGEQYGVPYTCLVPANLYGPGDHFGSESSHFLAAAIHKTVEAMRDGTSTVNYFGTGRAMRQYVLADDLAALVAYLVERGPAWQTFNVAPERSHSISELARLVAETAGFDGEIVFDGVGPDGQLRKDVDSGQLRKLYPRWGELETPLAEGLSFTIDRYRRDVEAR